MNNQQVKDYFKLPEKIYHLKGAAAPGSASRKNRRLWVDGVEIFPGTAFLLRPFYECDFDWGMEGGISSYTSALAVCLAIFKEERIAENLFEHFKEEYVQHFPEGDFEVTIDLTRFLKKFRARLHPHLYSRFCYSVLIDTREILLYKDPVSGVISANLAENYAMHNSSIPNVAVRRLNERKQRLLFRLFAKDKSVITGTNFEEIMEQVEEVMSKFYWRSLERLIRKQIGPLHSGKPDRKRQQDKEDTQGLL